MTMTTNRSEALVAELDHPRFRRIDGSVQSLLAQLALAGVGFAVASVITWALADRWLDIPADGGGVVIRAVMIGVIGGISLHVTNGHAIHSAVNDQRALVREATRELTAEAARHRFRSELDEGMRMCDDEPALVALVGRALDRLDPDGSMELLLADASNAHLRAAVESSAGGPGCGVSTPWECPAVRRGHTRHFETSTSLDACPHLRDRDGGPRSATCIPLTVLGSPVGVVHRTDPDRAGVPELVVDELETMVDLVGSRLSVIRAMATNERQANTDPLTGVRNRRSLGDEINALHRARTPYALAFCDLDHFKDLNDTFGHDVGDRALRLFTRVMNDTIRDHDIIGRWGGEEFVVLFPGTDRTVAAAACERVRLALQVEVQSAAVPPFTASFGVADHDQSDDVEGVIDLADRAMFTAKSLGRDRVVVADDTMTLRAEELMPARPATPADRGPAPISTGSDPA